jgi:hypothetical protein
MSRWQREPAADLESPFLDEELLRPAETNEGAERDEEWFEALDEPASAEAEEYEEADQELDHGEQAEFEPANDESGVAEECEDEPGIESRGAGVDLESGEGEAPEEEAGPSRPEFEDEAADTTLFNDRFQIHPDYNTGDPQQAPPVWRDSDRTRELLARKGSPGEKDREYLASALIRQVRTVVLYWQVSDYYRMMAAGTNPSPTMTLFVLLFPGEAKDNTGIKDLNDKVLGYQLNAQYTRRRQQVISELYWRPGDKFLLVGQDYKTATVLTLEGNRTEFVARLAVLDAKLRDILLREILPEAAKDAEAKGEKERLDKIKELQRTLEKNKKYRFDIFFGLTSVQPRAAAMPPIDTTFLLVTEALKGAAIAKFVAKEGAAKGALEKRFSKIIKPDPKKLDTRGKQYQEQPFLKAVVTAGDIKGFMAKSPHRDQPVDLLHIYVDTVWTVSFMKYRRWFIGNPDVIRDVRKKALVQPPTKAGLKYSLATQRFLLEMWLVLLNLLDFIKDFLLAEFRKEVVRYHDDALALFNQLRHRPFVQIDWPRLERVLTHDSRQTARIAVLGATSEFQFYSGAADHEERIFFSMDIRDLGVVMALAYEEANEEIAFRKYTGVRLMEETFKATDPGNEQRRFTYDRVVEVFRNYHAKLVATPAPGHPGLAEARRVFGADMRAHLDMPEFDQALQFMLGGDEVFVAAHPYFEKYVHAILGELDRTPLSSGIWNVRAAVAFSKAGKGDPATQRPRNQASHHQAMSLADQAPSILKTLERTNRRIERLIDMLEANPKKKDQAPQFRKQLEALRLLKLFARVNHGQPKLLSLPDVNRLLRVLRTGNVAAALATGRVELVDFDGTVVDAAGLSKKAAALEDAVRKKVGVDNTHVDPLPVTKMPKWIEKLLDKLFPIKTT